MTLWRIIFRSLSFHWRINASVALGVAAATAVLTGALVVGDSVRQSLRDLTLDRLGYISHVLVTDRFFRQELTHQLVKHSDFSRDYSSATPGILFPNGTVERSTSGKKLRTGSVFVVGVPEAFWRLGRGLVSPKMPGPDEVILNKPLADELGVSVDDQVTLRLPDELGVPADSTLAQKSGRSKSLPRLTVVAIVPAEGLGRFSLRPNQNVSTNAYLSLETLQDALDQEGKINAILVATDRIEPPPRSSTVPLEKLLKPSLEDYGFQIKRVAQSYTGDDGESHTVFDYFQLSTDRMVIPEDADRAIEQALVSDQGQPVITYLANTIAKVEDGRVIRESAIPYSTVTGIDVTDHFRPMTRRGSPLQSLDPGQVAINIWAAEQLQADVGDTLQLEYFAPETTHGDPEELRKRFRVAAVLPLTEPVEPYDRRQPAQYDQPPSVINDPDLTPVVEGITDQQTIDRWDPPFPYDNSRIREVDEQYWDNHRTTPKAFVGLETGRELWGSRFGQTTSYRIAAREGLTAKAIGEGVLNQFAADRVTLGFEFIAVKREGLAASKGTTPFDVLFLALSFFIIAAALLLVALLFRLGIEQRAAEVGTALAVGIPRGTATWMLVLEGLVISAVGAAIGIGVGVGYAWAMLAGLRSWWIGAVVTPFMSLHVGAFSLVLGYVSGVIVSVLTIIFSVRRYRKIAVRRLLAGEATEAADLDRPRHSWVRYVSLVLVLVAIGLGIAARSLGGEAQAGAFVGAGALLLTGLLLAIWRRLRIGSSKDNALSGRAPLFRLAGRNAGRNPTRSTITVALMATASFLIVAMSSFRLAPTEQGTAGFDLLAESSQPIFIDLNSTRELDDLLGERALQLQGTTVLPLRLKPGDDASCRNLYQSQTPQVLGVSQSMLQFFDDPQGPGFQFSNTLETGGPDASGPNAATPAAQNPWRLLEKEPTQAGDVPVILDKNTAMYSLHLYGGVGQTFPITYPNGREVSFEVVGLLSNSVLQGGLLIGESNFKKLYPEVSGYRYFLIRTPDGRQNEVAGILGDAFSDHGFSTRSTERILRDLMAVQNAYLSTFQSLGFLGLLLGTFGLATVQLRNVLERRKELGLMRAAGFRGGRLATMVLLENLFLLLTGLLTGTIAALLAIISHWYFGDASVPWKELGIMLVVVLAVGILSSLIAVAMTLRAPVLTALRGE